MVGCGFRLIILQPSRVQKTSRSNSATLIDNIYTNNMEIFCKHYFSISDHFSQFVTLMCLTITKVVINRFNMVEITKTSTSKMSLKMYIGKNYLNGKIPMIKDTHREN